MKFRAVVVLAVLLASGHAQAQQVDDRARGAARTLAEDGVTALQNGDATSAVDKLERAYEIIHLPTVGLWSARALVKAGRLVSAAERYVEVTRWTGTAADPKQEQAKNDASKERDELLPRIPNATFVIEGAKSSEVSVTLDGEPVLGALIGTAQPVDPKHHVLKGTRGTDAVEQPFDVAEGQSLTVTLKLGAKTAGGAPVVTTPTPAPPPSASPTPAPAADVKADQPSSWSTQKTIAVAVGGAGVVAAVVSGVFTAGALSKKSDADAYCKGSNCTNTKGVDLLSDARSSGNVATIAGVAGIALIGAGVVLYFTAPSGTGSGATTALGVAPAYIPGGGTVLATGSF